jgi:subtilisin family serine protease
VEITGLVPVNGADAIPTGVRRTGAAVGGTVREASPVNVAVIDTGVDLDHPDLNVAGGKDCTGSGTADDGNGHGTHVAGTIAARNNGSGVVGIVPGTKIWAVRVLNSNGSGSSSSVICGIDWVTSTRKDATASNDIAVANMSLGGRAPSGENCGRTTGDAMHAAICNSVAAGVTYVVAAGNDGADLKGYAPASYPEVVTVTSVSDADGLPGGLGRLGCMSDGDDTAATYSNFATRSVDAARLVAAPGSCITSTWPGGGHRSISGTSMASPHVAGLAALCMGDGATRGACAGKTPAQVGGILRQAAAAQSAAAPSSGFAGDPARPAPGREYGHLGATGFSEPTAPAPVPATAPQNTVRPAISGGATVGTPVSASTGSWTGAAPITYAAQWMRCTSASASSCAPITGATQTTYTPVPADQGRQLRIQVTARNSRGAAVALSDEVAVAARPVDRPAPPMLRSTPTITGTVATGQTLTASPGTWAGSQPMTFTYHWALCPPGRSVCTYTGTVGPRMTVPRVPVGTRYVFVMLARNAYGTAVAQSAVTGPQTMGAEQPQVVGLPQRLRG